MAFKENFDFAYKKRFGFYPETHFIMLRKKYGSISASCLMSINTDLVSDYLYIKHDKQIKAYNKSLVQMNPFLKDSNDIEQNEPKFYTLYYCNPVIHKLKKIATYDNFIKARQELRRLNRKLDKRFLKTGVKFKSHYVMFNDDKVNFLFKDFKIEY